MFLGERPRLGAATTGFIEGTVTLPSLEDWKLEFSVSEDGNAGADESDFVRVFLDGTMINDYLNNAIYPVPYLSTSAIATLCSLLGLAGLRRLRG